ncbi:MAG: hypothetical protein ACYS4T_18960 [Planctomycetota bacterium]|jgi:hypothetical protein
MIVNKAMPTSASFSSHHRTQAEFIYHNRQFFYRGKWMTSHEKTPDHEQNANTPSISEKVHKTKQASNGIKNAL